MNTNQLKKNVFIRIHIYNLLGAFRQNSPEKGQFSKRTTLRCFGCYLDGNLGLYVTFNLNSFIGGMINSKDNCV